MGKLVKKSAYREQMRKIGQDLSDAYAKKAMALYSKPEVEEEKKQEEQEEKVDEIEVKSEEENENEKKKRHHSGIARMHSRYDIRQKGGLI